MVSGDNDEKELDVCAAIQAHVQWKLRLQRYIRGESEEQLDPVRVGCDKSCSLGQWLHSHGEESYGSHEKFQRLKAVHADFHSYAADVIHAVHRGERDHAKRLLHHGEYPKVSNRIKSMLAGLSLAFDFG
ncbi:MAG: CZB domain-containing protein [Pseudomonadota bacterium]